MTMSLWCQAGSKLAAAEAQAKAASRMQWRAGMERKSRAIASGGKSIRHHICKYASLERTGRK